MCAKRLPLRLIRPRSLGNISRAYSLKAAREPFLKRCSAPVAEMNHKPLAGKRVVVTRALEQSQSLVDALRDSAAEPIVLPLVAFAPADNPAELDGCLKNSPRFDRDFLTPQNPLPPAHH